MDQLLLQPETSISSVVTVFILMILLFGSFAEAADHGLLPCPKRITQVLVNPKALVTDESKELLAFHEKTIQEVNSFLGELEHYPVIVLHATLSAAIRPRAWIDGNTGVLHTFHRGPRKQSSGENYDPMTVHEYSHFLFAYNLLKRLGSKLEAIRNEGWGAEWNTDIETVRRIRVFRLKQMAWGSNPYTEFFADLVAVLHSCDPSAMSNTLELVYSEPHPFRNFKKPEGDVQSRYEYKHDFFYKVRWFVGDYFLSDLKFCEHRSEILGTVYHALEEDILERILKPGYGDMYLEDAAVGQLIEKIATYRVW